MSRGATTLDRVATLIIALLLICAGALVIAWRFHWGALPTASDTSSITSILHHDWWPWVEAAAGILFVLAGLRWVWAHVPTGGVKELNLPDAGPGGRSRFNARAVAATAADVLTDTPGVRSAAGTVTRDRGRLVFDIVATIDATADLDQVAPAADRVINDLATVTNRRDLYGRVHLIASKKTTSSGRRVS